MKNYLWLIMYTAISLLVGREFHPFSNYPMYNSFPNYGYAFFLSTEKGTLIPFSTTFSGHKNAGYIGHIFYSFFNAHSYPFGDGKEKPEHLQQAGEAMMGVILENESTDNLLSDTLRLFRRFYFLDEKQLRYRDDLMYEISIQP